MADAKWDDFLPDATELAEARLPQTEEAIVRDICRWLGASPKAWLDAQGPQGGFDGLPGFCRLYGLPVMLEAVVLERRRTDGLLTGMWRKFNKSPIVEAFTEAARKYPGGVSCGIVFTWPAISRRVVFHEMPPVSGAAGVRLTWAAPVKNQYYTLETLKQFCSELPSDQYRY